ncbi:MAG: hypothetical protein ACM3SP_05125 [Chloroflexota bacterium]
MRHTILVAIIGISLLVAACGKEPKDDGSKPAPGAAEVKKEAAETYEALKSYATKKHEEYREKAEAALKSYEQRFQELKAKAEKAGGEAKKKYREAEQAWQEKAKALREQLAALKTASVKAWENMEKKIDAGLEQLRKLSDKARSADT